MKYFLVLLVLVSLAIVGCANDNSQAPTSPVSSDMTLPLGKATPFKMTLAGQGHPLSPPSGKCESAIIEMEVTGTGIATQLGKLTFIQTHCVSLDGNTLVFSNGESTITAANGDELHGTYFGTLSPEFPTNVQIFSVGGEVTINGGTGRFTNATGELAVTGTLDITSLESTLNLDGTIELR